MIPKVGKDMGTKIFLYFVGVIDNWFSLLGEQFGWAFFFKVYTFQLSKATSSHLS